MGRCNTAGLTGCRAKESDPIRVTLAAEGAIHRASRNTRAMHNEREVEAEVAGEGTERRAKSWKFYLRKRANGTCQQVVHVVKR